MSAPRALRGSFWRDALGGLLVVPALVGLAVDDVLRGASTWNLVILAITVSLWVYWIAHTIVEWTREGK